MEYWAKVVQEKINSKKLRPKCIKCIRTGNERVNSFTTKVLIIKKPIY